MALPSIKNVSKIAERFSLDYWWVESVIVEYFDCRRYAKNGQLWTFDFNKITQDEINQIPDKKVIIPRFVLLQNIRPYDLWYRSQAAQEGLPFVTIEDAELIPEGLANRTCFPYGNWNDLLNSKMGFSERAIVRDNGAYYQWTVSKKLELMGKKHHWYASNICALDRLYEINQEIQQYKNLLLLKKPTLEFVLQVSEIYKKLEEERGKIRDKILAYHNKKKHDFDLKDVDVPDPPILSYFEAVKPVKDGYHVLTHMEPLFFHSAIRHKVLAQKVRDSRLNYLDISEHEAFSHEIEHSAMCIISAISCLESYINYIIKKYIPKKSKKLEKASLLQKWLCVSSTLELSHKLNPEQSPFSDFATLITLRNNIIHYKPVYVKAEGSAKVVNQFHLQNAEMAIRVVKEMVTAISVDGKIPTPPWIKTSRPDTECWNGTSAAPLHMRLESKSSP